MTLSFTNPIPAIRYSVENVAEVSLEIPAIVFFTLVVNP